MSRRFARRYEMTSAAWMVIPNADLIREDDASRMRRADGEQRCVDLWRGTTRAFEIARD